MPMFLSSRGKMDYKLRPVGQHGSEDVLRSLGGSRSPTGSGGQLNLILCTEMFAGPHWEAPAFLAVGTAKTQTQEVGWGVQEIRVAGVSSPRGRGGIVRNRVENQAKVKQQKALCIWPKCVNWLPDKMGCESC